MSKYDLHTSTYIAPTHNSTDLFPVLTMTLTNTSDVFDPKSELERLNDKQLFYLMPSILYTAILMLVGTPGNGIVLYVYFFKWRKSTSRMFILFLTGLDFLNCVTTLPMEIYIMRYSFMLDIPWLCKTSRFGTYTMNSASAAILVGIAVDRFRRICRPHGSQFSARFSKYICIGCIIFALTLTWPVLLLFGTRYIKLGSVTGTSCLLENKFDTSSYPYIYFVVMMGSTVIIFTTLSVLYYFVGLQICKHRKLRQKRRRQMKKVLVEKSSSKSNSANLLKGTDTDDLKLAAAANGLKNKQENVGIDKGDINNQSTLNELVPCTNDELTSTYVETSRHNDETEKDIKQAGTDNCTSKQNNDKEDTNGDVLEPLTISESCQPTEKRTENKSLFKRNALLQSSSVEHNSGCMRLNIRVGKSTLMLFLITLAYIISFLPYYTLAIIRQSEKRFVSQLSGAGYMTYHFFLRSYQLSSAINPIIYSFCNAQFRSFVLDLFHKQSSRIH